MKGMKRAQNLEETVQYSPCACLFLRKDNNTGTIQTDKQKKSNLTSTKRIIELQILQS
jgi:hypothetical protein